MKLLFKYLNFMELMGAIYEMKEKDLIDEDLLNQLFGQKLKIYIKFYEAYFEEEFGKNYAEKSNCPPAAKLLTHFEKGGREMTLFKWLDSKIKKLSWYDISLIKLSAIALVLLLAKYWPVLLSFEWYWYMLVFIAAAIPPLIKFYEKEE